MAVSDAVGRSGRGLSQGGVGAFIVECIEAFELYDFTKRQYGLAVLGIGAIICFLQNAAENRGLIPAVLKKQPAEETNPVLDTSALGV